MEDKKYNIIKAASWYTIGSFLIKGVSFFVLPIFTRLMDTHEYGIYSIYTSYQSIIEVIILLGLSVTIPIAKYAHEVDYNSYISTAVLVPVGLALVLTISINLYLLKFDTLLSMARILWNCILISATCNAVSNIIMAKLIADGEYRLSMAYSGLYTVTNVLFSLAFCYFIFRENKTHLARVYASTIASLISVTFLIRRTKTRFVWKSENIKYTLLWGIPLFFHTLASTVLIQSDRIVIRYIESYSSAGVYAIATTIVSIPMVLQSSLNHAWTPWVYEKLNNKDYLSIRSLNGKYVCLFAGIIAVFMLVSPDIIHIFSAPDYWESEYCLIPLSFSVFGEIIYSIPATVEYFNKKTLYIMIGTVIAVVINVFLDIIFVLWFGITGAAYATAISKFFLFLMHFYLAKKIDSNSVIGSKHIICTAFFLTCINFFAVLNVNNVLGRYIVVIAIVILGLIFIRMNRKLIKLYMRNH